jgi:hypothetical protein
MSNFEVISLFMNYHYFKEKQEQQHQYRLFLNHFYFAIYQSLDSVEDQEIQAVPGDTVFVPRGVSHTFKVKTETSLAIIATTSTDFENFIEELAIPRTSEHHLPQPPTPEQIGKWIEVGKKYGLTFQI